ncbi:hypothetical protein ALC53_04026 [Atta colombica]|uniref:Uncharacterized protein n=1 Tax=Atta colombica TaxID=520822 RepID=A0A195BLK1_9HYME|nr:hypothetical protein ALC53_04026 [Atta colombica]
MSPSALICCEGKQWWLRLAALVFRTCIIKRKEHHRVEHRRCHFHDVECRGKPNYTSVEVIKGCADSRQLLGRSELYGEEREVPASEKTVQARNRSWGNYYPFKIDTPAKQAAERSEFRDIAVKESVREMRGKEE